MAISVGTADYRFVRRYLAKRDEDDKDALQQVDPLIRSLEHYRDFINSKLNKEGT